ncbi:MAG TPA: hypothetical protein VNL77_15905 [Roseiflexaceae bacterium]|nr:hypothetical protein [Roseiflexaceae bacterium]
MALNTYTESTHTRVLYGGPRNGRSTKTSYERSEHPAFGGRGSHMPLDTDIHWDWRNPLNIIPASMLLLLVIAVVGLILGI